MTPSGFNSSDLSLFCYSEDLTGISNGNFRDETIINIFLFVIKGFKHFKKPPIEKTGPELARTGFRILNVLGR